MKKYLLIILIYTLLLTSCSTQSVMQNYIKNHPLNYKFEPGYYECNITYFIDWKQTPDKNEPNVKNFRPNNGKLNIKGYAFQDYASEEFETAFYEHFLLFDKIIINYEIDSYKYEFNDSPVYGYAKTNNNVTIINNHSTKSNKILFNDDCRVIYTIPTITLNPKSIGILKYYDDKDKFNCSYTVNDDEVKYSYSFRTRRKDITEFLEFDRHPYHISTLLDYCYTSLDFLHTMHFTLSNNVVKTLSTSLIFNFPNTDINKAQLNLDLKTIDEFDIIIDEDTSNANYLKPDANKILVFDINKDLRYEFHYFKKFFPSN